MTSASNPTFTLASLTALHVAGSALEGENALKSKVSDLTSSAMSIESQIAQVAGEVSTIDLRMPIREGNKKAAAASRDFKEAANVSKEIKEALAKKEQLIEKQNDLDQGLKDANEEKAKAEAELETCRQALKAIGAR